MNITREPNEINAAKNPIGIEVQGRAGFLAYDVYQIGVKVWYDPFHTNVYNLVDIDTRSTPDQLTGKVTFDLGRILKSLLKNDRPEWLSASAKKCTNNNFRFYVEVEEYIDTVKQTSINSNIFRVVNAGFSDYVGQFLNSYVNSQKFLTHQPREKTVSPHQREFLYYIAPAAGTYTLNTDIVFEDGSTQTAYSGVAPSVVAQKHDVLLFPCGYYALGLDQFQSPGVASWEVYLTGDKSEKQKFVLDCSYQPRDRFYLFANSLGGYDTLRATGRLKENILTTSVAAQQARPVFYDATEPYIKNVDTQSQGVFTQDTGLLSSPGADWLRDLLISEDPLRIGAQYHNPQALGEYWPIAIGRGESPIREDDNFLYGQAFRYTDAFLNKGL